MSALLLVSPQAAFLSVSGALLLATAVFVIACKPILGLWAVAIVFALQYATPFLVFVPGLMAGSVHITAADVLSVVLLSAAILKIIQRPPPARIMVPISAAGLIFAVNLGRGIAEFGMQHAVNEAREWLYFLIGTTFVVAAGPWSPRFWRPLFVLAGALMGAAWVGLARNGLHPVTSRVAVGGRLIDPRPLTAAAAIVLTCALIAMLGSRTLSSRVKAVSGVLIVGTLVFVQQRTAWAVAAMTFLIWAAVTLRAQTEARYRHLAAGGVAVLGVAVVALASGLAARSVLGRSLAETAARQSTFQYRVVGWLDLLRSDQSAAGLVFGESFGTGYHRSIFGVATNVAPHSFYVATLLRLGVIGAIALAFLYWTAWRYRRQAAAALGISPLTVSLLLAALLIYSFTYEPGMLVGALIAGLLVWEPRKQQQPAATVRRPSGLLLGEGR